MLQYNQQKLYHYYLNLGKLQHLVDLVVGPGSGLLLEADQPGRGLVVGDGGGVEGLLQACHLSPLLLGPGLIKFK